MTSQALLTGSRSSTGLHLEHPANGARQRRCKRMPTAQTVGWHGRAITEATSPSLNEPQNDGLSVWHVHDLDDEQLPWREQCGTAQQSVRTGRE